MGNNALHVKPGRQNKNYRPEIDGLRAIAILAVIANHFNKPSLPSGHLGVDIFFVISGFVITSSLAHQQSPDFKEYLLRFYTRRIRRLLPALAVFCLVTGVIICLFNSLPSDAIEAGIAALFGISNIYFYRESTNYFAHATELNPFTHTWSLGVEEQFYLLFPLLAWITGFSRHDQHGAKRLGLLISGLSLVSLVSFLFLIRTNQPAAFFLVTSRFWELGTGCLLFLLMHKRSRLSAAIRRIPPVIPFSIVIILLCIPGKSKEIVGLVTATSILIGSLRQGTGIHSLLANKHLVSIGLLSYSLYLWHWGVLAISRWTIGVHAWTIPFQVVAMGVLSFGSYKLIEQPLRIRQWSKKPLFTIFYGIGATSTIASLLALIGFNPSFYLFTGRRPLLPREQHKTLTTPYSLSTKQGVTTWKGEACVISKGTDIGKVISPFDCALGDINKAKSRILVAGNSFSATFPSGFDDLVRDDHYSVIVTSSYGASPAPELTTGNKIFQEMSDYYWTTAFQNLAKILKPGDWVFLVSDIAYYTPLKREASDEARLRELEIALAKLSSNLAHRGIRLAMLHGIPYARDASCEPALGMHQWFNSIGDGPCTFYSKQETIARRKPLDNALKRLEKSRKLVIIDLLPVFCPFTTCSYEGVGNTLLYRDGNSHPTHEAIGLAAPLIRKTFHQAQ